MSLPAEEKEHFVHGHSSLVRLLDEVEAHIDGLQGCQTPDFMIEEMKPYWNAFKLELIEHIDEEETEMFPHLTGRNDRNLRTLQKQHADLKSRVDEITQFIQTYRHSEEHFKKFQWLIDDFRAAFKRHSADERAFIQRSVGAP